VRPENIEFIALFEASGWKAIHAAQRLRVTRATLSRYLSGDIAPSAPVIELFKLILLTEKPGALTVAAEAHETKLETWERKAIEDLRWLHIEDRERVLNAMRAFIAGLPRRNPVRYVSSNVGDRAARARIKGIARGLRKPSKSAS
jgi:transcriptional regulator with XRE-family HTH domain